jgi:hypothetical protein
VPLRAGVTESPLSVLYGDDDSLNIRESDTDLYVLPPREQGRVLDSNLVQQCM